MGRPPVSLAAQCVADKESLESRKSAQVIYQMMTRLDGYYIGGYTLDAVIVGAYVSLSKHDISDDEIYERIASGINEMFDGLVAIR